MFNGIPFYFGLTRKYVILIGTLFNNIHISRENAAGVQTGLFRVPITYAPKDKMLARVLQDPGIDRPTAVTPLPLISFELVDMSYDSSRKLNTVGRVARKISTDNDRLKYQYNPVPYNFNFKVYIYTLYVEDASKIVEQILPYFTPDWTTTVNLIPEMETNIDIPVVLNNIGYTDNYDDSYQNRRAIIWELDLTLKGFLYGPTKSSKIIKFVKADFLIPTVPDGQIPTQVGNIPVSEQLIVRPGLTANGTPTTVAGESVPYSLISIDDDYGYITHINNDREII